MRYLDKPQLRALLSAAKAESAQDHLLILVTYWHGLRASEAINIHSRDIDGGYITIKRLKGSMRTRQRLIESADPLFNEKALLGMCASGKLFDGYTRHDFRNRMVRYCKKAGIPKALAFPHVLKHSIAKHMIAKGGIENTRQWLGHVSIASTGAYIKCTDDEAYEAMISAVEAA